MGPAIVIVPLATYATRRDVMRRYATLRSSFYSYFNSSIRGSLL